VSLPEVTVVTDPGVLVDNNLRFTKHYRSIVNKANHRSSLILKSFQSRNPHDRLVILDNADTLETRRLKMDLIIILKLLIT